MRGVLTVKISARVFSGLLDACVAKPGGLLWILGFAVVQLRRRFREGGGQVEA